MIDMLEVPTMPLAPQSIQILAMSLQCVLNKLMLAIKHVAKMD